MHSKLTTLVLVVLASVASVACTREGDDVSNEEGLVQEQVLTHENFLTHPRVLEIDKVVAASEGSLEAKDAKQEAKGEYSPNGKPKLCDFGEIGRSLGQDGEGRVRKVKSLMGTEHTLVTSTRYFDESGALRYVEDVALQSEDGEFTTRYETRGYFNGQGQLFFEAFRATTSPDDSDPNFDGPFGPAEGDDAYWSLSNRDYPDTASATRAWFDAPATCD